MINKNKKFNYKEYKYEVTPSNVKSMTAALKIQKINCCNNSFATYFLKKVSVIMLGRVGFQLLPIIGLTGYNSNTVIFT